MWTKLLAIWAAIAPYLTAANFAAIEAAFQQAVTDFNGGNYAAVVDDLVKAIETILGPVAAQAARKQA